MVNLQIRIDDELKNQAQEVAHGLGIDLTTAVRMFLKQMVADRALPFKPELNSFYRHENMSFIKKSINELHDNKLITKNIKDLENMAK